MRCPIRPLLSAIVLLIVVLPLCLGPAHATNETETDMVQLLRKRLGDIASPFILSGCAPTVPSPASLTFAAFACEGNVVESGKLIPVVQAAAAVGPLNAGNGTYWLALYKDRSSAVVGWTRQAGTHYLWQFSTTQPAGPAGGLTFREVTVAGGIITSSAPSRYFPTTSLQDRVYRLTDPWLGGVCNGSTDDSAALQRANTLPARSTVIIPNARCVIAATVTFTRAINLVGSGPDSVLSLTMGTGSDGIVYNAGGTTLIYGPELRDFAIIGGTNSARNCLVMRYITLAHVKNVHVFCGTAATGYAVWLQDFILQSHFQFIINGTYVGSPSIGAVPSNGVKATVTPGDTAGTFNANVFDLDITGPGTAGSIGLWIRSSGGGGGNNDIRGTYQGWGGDGIFVQGGDKTHIHDAHLEGGDTSRSNRIHLQDANFYKLGPNVLVTAGTPATNIFIQTSSHGVIDDVSGDVLRLDASPNTLVGRVQLQNVIGSHLEDASIQTTWLTPVVSTGDLRLEVGPLMDGSSIAVNGSAERWTTTTSAPPSIAAGIGGAATWAREATIVRHGLYSISVNTTAAALSGVNILTAAQTAALAGRKVTFSAWVYVPAGQPDITPYLYFNNGVQTAGYNIISTKAAWVQVTGAIAIAANGTIGAGGRTTAALIFVPASGTTSYYIDAVSVVPSHAGASVFYTQNADEYQRFDALVTISPGLIAANTTVGTSVTVNGAAVNDICSLGPPAGIDAGLGWSCVVTAADTVNVRIHNVSAGGITPASASWTVLVTRRP